LRILAILSSAILPRAAREIFYQLNIHDEHKLSDANWGGLPEKHRLGKPVPLFPRIES
jgi:methionyl-tRNA synthetase